MSAKHTLFRGFILWGIAFLLIIAGLFLSINHYLDQDWLSRAGCLIVVMGIWSGLGGILQERLLIKRLQLRRRMSIIKIKRKYRHQQEECDKRIDEVQKAFDDGQIKLQHELRFSVGALEASLLLTGTLFWGFGDLTKYFLT